MDLKRYRGEGGGAPRDNPKRDIESPGNRFVIQEHWATRFHYDFRLEIVDENQEVSVLHSWMVPKNIPLEAEVRHLAIKVDNKHLDFLELDQKTMGGQFGKGQLKIWDKGRWGLMKGSVGSGQIAFNLFGDIVKARYVMQKREFDGRLKSQGSRQEPLNPRRRLKSQGSRQEPLNPREAKDYWVIWKSVGWE